MSLESFKAEVEAFIEREGMNPTEFGRRFASDPNFVFDLREKGREPREATRSKILEAMASTSEQAA